MVCDHKFSVNALIGLPEGLFLTARVLIGVPEGLFQKIGDAFEVRGALCSSFRHHLERFEALLFSQRGLPARTGKHLR
jgi:hypothetical protein